VRRADNLTTFMCPVSGNLEPSGSVQACNGIVLPFFTCSRVKHFKKKFDYLRFEEGTGIFCRNIGNKQTTNIKGVTSHKSEGPQLHSGGSLKSCTLYSFSRP